MKKLILFLLLAGVSAFSQTTVAIAPLALPQFLDNSGSVCSGCKLSTFSAGTTSNLATYQDSSGTILQQNPIVMDSTGRPPAPIFLTSAAYKFVMKDANGVTLWSADNVTWGTPLSTFAGIINTGNETLQQATAATSGANQSSNLWKLCGNYWTGAASAADCWTFQDVLGAGSNPTTTLSLTHSGSSGTILADLSNVTIKANVKSLNNIQFSSQYKLGDWCADAAAADIVLGQKGGQIWVDKSDGTLCASNFTLRNDLVFIDDASYSVRKISIATGGIGIYGRGLTNAGSTPQGTLLTYVGSAGSDAISILGLVSARLDKVIIENVLIDGNNTARYDLRVEKADTTSLINARFRNAATANIYYQDAIDWTWFNVGVTFCNSYCIIFDGGSGNGHWYGGQTEQAVASTNPQVVISGTNNTMILDGIDFDTCNPFGGFLLIQGQDGANSAFAGATAGIGQGRPINVTIAHSLLNYCTGSTAAAQGADILITDASAAQQPTDINLENLQMSADGGPGAVAVKTDQALRVFLRRVRSTGHTSGSAATLLTTVNSSLIKMDDIVSGDSNRVGGVATAVQDCQLSASGATSCSGKWQVGDGATATPGLAWTSDTTTGWSRPGGGYSRYSTAGNDDFLLSPTGTVLHTGFIYGIANGDSFSSSCLTGVGSTAQGVVTSSTSCSTANANGSFKAAAFISGGAGATLTGTGACATITTQTGGSMAGRATCTGATAASTLTITPGTTAPNGWVCYVQDQTTRANLLQQTANTATTCTLTATSVTQNDVFVFTAIAF